MAKSEGSVSTWKGRMGSGWTNMGEERKVALRALTTLCVAGVQGNGVSFSVSWMRGWTREENLSIKICKTKK